MGNHIPVLRFKQVRIRTLKTRGSEERFEDFLNNYDEIIASIRE